MAVLFAIYLPVACDILADLSKLHKGYGSATYGQATKCSKYKI